MCKDNKMIPLNLPPYSTKLRRKCGRLYILDDVRRRYVALTPEEWVRQHFVHYLIEKLGFPASLTANEVRLELGEKVLRADTVVYDRSLHPLMIVEYKAPHIKLTQHVFDQISAYNILLHVDYLTVSNGMESYCCKMDYDNKTYAFLESIPDYQNILQSRPTNPDNTRTTGSL